MPQGDSHQSSYIRQKVTNGEYQFRPHAVERMSKRKIWMDDVCQAITDGQVLEVQDFGKMNVKVIFQEATCEIPGFAVVVAADYPVVQIVTVFRFKEEKGYEYIEKQNCWRRIR